MPTPNGHLALHSNFTTAAAASALHRTAPALPRGLPRTRAGPRYEVDAAPATGIALSAIATRARAPPNESE